MRINAGFGAVTRPSPSSFRHVHEARPPQDMLHAARAQTAALGILFVRCAETDRRFRTRATVRDRSLLGRLLGRPLHSGLLGCPTLHQSSAHLAFTPLQERAGGAFFSSITLTVPSKASKPLLKMGEGRIGRRLGVRLGSPETSMHRRFSCGISVR